VLVSPGVGSALAGIINPERAAVHRLPFQNFFGDRGAIHINEVGVREASRLAGAAVDGDSYVKDVTNLPEKVVEVPVAHLVRHVANEKRVAGLSRGLCSLGVAALVMLNGEAPTLKDRLIHSLDSVFGLRRSAELNVSKTLAQAPVVRDHSAVGDLTVLGKFSLQLRGSDLKEEVADIQDFTRDFGSIGRKPGVLVGVEAIVRVARRVLETACAGEGMVSCAASVTFEATSFAFSASSEACSPTLWGWCSLCPTGSEVVPDDSETASCAAEDSDVEVGIGSGCCSL